MTHVMIIKVDFDRDVRRISMELPEGATSSQTFQAIRTAVAQGFEIDEAALPALKYKDEEGDLCTLVEASVDDMLEFSKGGTLRLCMSRTSEEKVEKDGTPGPVPEEPPAADADADAVEEGVEAPQSREKAAEDALNEEDEKDDVEEAAVEDFAIENAGSEKPDELVDAPEDEAEAVAAAQDEEAESPAADQDEEAQPQRAQHLDALPELMAMGFDEEQAKQALAGADGNMELAIEYLVNGKPAVEAEPSVFEQLDENLRALPGNVREQLQKLRYQLQEMVNTVKQHRARFQERMESGEFEHLQGLQATLEQMKVRLREFKELVQGGLKKASGSQPEAAEEEALRKAEAQLADAQHFVAETLASLQARGSEAFKGATEKFASKSEPEGAQETMDAAAMAAVDAAEVAAATVDEFLAAEQAVGSASAESSSTTRPSVKGATRMDHVQVFVSKSVSGLRAIASGLTFVSRRDPWVTVGSVAPTAPYPSSAAAADEAATAQADSESPTVAATAAVSELDAEAVQAETSDEFVHVAVDPTDANA